MWVGRSRPFTRAYSTGPASALPARALADAAPCLSELLVFNYSPEDAQVLSVLLVGLQLRIRPVWKIMIRRVSPVCAELETSVLEMVMVELEKLASFDRGKPELSNIR